MSPSWPGLIIATAPVLLVIALLWAQRLGQVRPLLLALVRLVVQLLLMGLVLDWLFRKRNPWLLGAVAMGMLLAAAQVVDRRAGRRGWTARAEAFGAMGVSVALVMAVSIRGALHLDPWYEPRVLIPLLGMILGNSATGVALAAERLEGELRSGRDLVEWRLCLGASTRQAAAPALRAAVRAALTPAIQNMMIAGVVSIPGMVTGQLLAGAEVGGAIRYQILIYLGITATVALSTMGLLTLRLKRHFTPSHQLRLDPPARDEGRA